MTECSVADQAETADWLVTGVERRAEQVRVKLLGWLCGRRLEPQTGGRMWDSSEVRSLGKNRAGMTADRGLGGRG